MKKKTVSLLLLAFFPLSSCTYLFFRPSGVKYADPAALGCEYEVVRFVSGDGTPLTGMFFPGKGGAKATIVHFHGNAQNMTSHFVYSAWFAEEGFNVFIFDYRGYGASGGKPSLSGAVSDGVSALEFVLSRGDVRKDRVVVFGQSLGAALALSALGEMPDFRPALVILEGAFSSYKAVASKVMRRRFFLLPLSWIPYILVSDRYMPLDAARRLNSPVILIHSPNDPVVPFSEGERLYEAIRAEKFFWKPPSGHIEAFGLHGGVYRPKILKKINALLAREERGAAR